MCAINSVVATALQRAQFQPPVIDRLSAATSVPRQEPDACTPVERPVITRLPDIYPQLMHRWNKPPAQA
jgi:hypothetical protein